MLFATPAPVPPAGCWQLKVRRSGAEGQGSGLQVSPDVKVGFFAAGLVHGLTAEMVRKAGICLACGGELSSGHCMMQAWCWKQCIAMTALLHAQHFGGWVLLAVSRGAPSCGSSFRPPTETPLSISAVALLLQGGCQISLPDADPQGSGPVIELCPWDWPPSRAPLCSLRPGNSRGPAAECQVNARS